MKKIVVAVVGNLSMLVRARCRWVVLDNRNWMHPFDDQGRPLYYKRIRQSIGGLVDDPFRSLSASSSAPVSPRTRRRSASPVADALRRNIKRKLVERDRSAIPAQKPA